MKKINAALCSFGMSGMIFHAPFIQLHEGFNLYAVWERTSKKANEIYPSIKSYKKLDEMLADENIDLVVVNTPNYTHFEFAKKALLAGKHVLVEKSFTVTAKEAEELVNLAKEVGKKLAVYQNRRFDSDFKTVKKVVDENLLGEVVEAEIHYDRYNLNLSPKLHKETNQPGAGLLHDLGPHIIDQALYLFGMPTSVFGFLKITRPESTVNDYIDIMLFYPKLTLRLKAGLIVKEPQPSYIFHGKNGSFLKYRADLQEDALKAGELPDNENWGKEYPDKQGLLNYLVDDVTVKKYILSQKGNYMELYNGLYNAIVEDTEPPISGQDGLNVMKIIEAVLESNSTKAVVQL